jgi:hypothetical protein
MLVHNSTLQNSTCKNVRTLDMISHNKQNYNKQNCNKQNYTNPINPWVSGLLLIVTDHIQGWVRLGLMPNQSPGLVEPC